MDGEAAAGIGEGGGNRHAGDRSLAAIGVVAALSPAVATTHSGVSA